MDDVIHLGTLESVIDDAHRRMWRRRGLWSVAGLVALALGLGSFFAVGNGGARPASHAQRSQANDRGPGVVLGEWFPLSRGSAPFFGGITKPPGGAELVHKRALLTRPTAVGAATIWMAPDFAVRGQCAWLTVGGRVYGGVCRRADPPRRGLSEVVPLSLAIQGRTVRLVWGNVGADVTRLALRFSKHGKTTGLRIAGGAFLYVVPASHRGTGLWLVAHIRGAFPFNRKFVGGSH